MKITMKSTKPKIELLEDVVDEIANFLGCQINVCGGMIGLQGTEKDPHPGMFSSGIFDRTTVIGVLKSEIRNMDSRIRKLEEGSGVCTKCGKPTKKK
jgi:hypothetical protein